MGNWKSRVAVGLVALSAMSCGGDKQPAPTAPTKRSAAVTVSTLTASLSYSGTDKKYGIRLVLRETTGETGATVGAIDFTFYGSDGAAIATATTNEAWASTRLNPGATLEARGMDLSDRDGNRPAATRITARVSYVDDIQVSGSASTSADITQPAPPPAFFTLAGVLSEDPDGVALPGGLVSVVSGVNAGKSSGTDGNGYYSIPGLQNGTFTLRASKAGYQSVDRQVTLAADTRFDMAIRAIALPPPPPGNSMTCSGVPGNAACGRPTARCQDGAWSCSQNRSGTCSSHGGVACWVCPGPLCQQ